MSGPDWGWRIFIEQTDTDHFRLMMYNITPDGREEQAVEARYIRSSA